MNSITIEEVKELPKDSYQLIDIRDAESIAHGAIPGAIAAPQEDILSCEEVDPSKKLVICCSRCKFSVEAADKLREKGIDAVSLEGGYVAWLMDFMSAPEEKDVAADLAGKPALFKVKIHEVKAKELPELNDEFAQDVSEFNTLEEYKEDLKKHLEVQKEDEAKRTKEDEAIQKIIDKSTMEIPEAMIKTQCENMVNEFAQRLAQGGLSMEQYMQFSGLTLDKLEEQVRPEAETRIKSSLVLEQIAKDENIEVSEEEIDAEIEKMAKAYGMEADKLKEYMGDAEKESMKRDISVTKAVDLVMENVKERAKAKTKKEKEAEAEENAEE